MPLPPPREQGKQAWKLCNVAKQTPNKYSVPELRIDDIIQADVCGHKDEREDKIELGLPNSQRGVGLAVGSTESGLISV
jgi:hypothetical protein